MLPTRAVDRYSLDCRTGEGIWVGIEEEAQVLGFMGKLSGKGFSFTASQFIECNEANHASDVMEYFTDGAVRVLKEDFEVVSFGF